MVAKYGKFGAIPNLPYFYGQQFHTMLQNQVGDHDRSAANDVRDMPFFADFD